MPLKYALEDCLATTITPDDRSFRFGDGVFETLIVHRGKLFHPEAHQHRLQRGLAYFQILLSIDDFVPVLQNACPITEGYLRVVVSRGQGTALSMGYAITDDLKPTVIVQGVAKDVTPWGDAVPLWQRLKIPMNALVSSVPLVYLYPCKTNNALPYVLALQEATQAGCQQAILTNPQGIVCETATANIAWIKDDVIYTPAPDLPMVPSTIRQWVEQHGGYPIRYVHHTLKDLWEADGVFIMNVGGLIAPLMGIKTTNAVKQWDAVHPIITDLAHRLIACIRGSA